MLSNISEFEVLLARYDDDPAICSKMLRTYALTEPQNFLAYAEECILSQSPTRAVKFVAGLAISSGLMDRLIAAYSTSREQTITLARRLMTCDSRFDLTFLEFLQKPRPAHPGEENFFHAGLDILDAISESDKLVPGVLKILKHPNPKVRSKAALFVGSRTQNLAWAANRTEDYDPRVRANIIESLYGINSDFVEKIFRDNVNDEHNRVAGNAVLGLYLLGDASSVPLIYDMAKHPEARFRNTSAWLMGRTGDPRFAHAFSELMNDPEPLVRAQAFKGLGEVRKALRSAVTRPEWTASIVKATLTGDAHLIATVHDESGQPVRGLSGTSFIVKSGSPAKAVRRYAADEYDCRSALNVAFILCLPEQNAEAAEARFTKVVQSCASLRRSKDKWAVVKVNPFATATRHDSSSSESYGQYKKMSILHVDYVGPGAAAQELPRLEYTNSPQRIDAMLRERPLTVSSPGDDLNRSVLDCLLRVDVASSDPALIFLGAGPQPHLIPDLAARKDLAGSVHVCAEHHAWQTDDVRAVTDATKGSFLTPAEPGDLQPRAFALYSSLMHHYRIGWSAPDTPEPVELDVFAEHGRASASVEAA